MKKIIANVLAIAIICSLFITVNFVKHDDVFAYSNPNHKCAIKLNSPKRKIPVFISTNKDGKVFYAPWVIRSSNIVKVNKNEGGAALEGKKYTSEKTFTTSITASLSNKVKTSVGYTKKWSNEVFEVQAKIAGSNATNKTRYIGYAYRNQYQMYKTTYRYDIQCQCITCGKWITINKGDNKVAYSFKKTGIDDAFFYSNSKGALTNKVLQCCSKNGVIYEEGQYMCKNGKALVGEATKNNQNYNAFSNISYWK